MEFERYTEQAIKALSGAQKAARSFGHSFVGSEHLLMGIIKCGDKTAQKLMAFGVTADAASPYIDTVVGGGRNIFTDSFGNTPSVKRILELSLYEAKSMGKELIDTEHILLSIMRERDSLGARIIDTLCRDRDSLRAALLGLDNRQTPYPNGGADDITDRNYNRSNDPGRGRTPVLDSFARDLTELARAGRIDPVIGRDQEIARVLQTLCRRTKNNPVLIGEPGVGKSAIAEGIAVRIVEGKVPAALCDMRILSLDLGAMIAGTKYRGEFEERLKSALEELTADKDTVLFIDEIHTIVGAGAGEGSIDAANIMKPALARGELRVIGATTVDEYRAYIEKDAALERRFSPILISEPDEEQTKAILQGLKSRYEAHHGVIIDNSAIEAAAELSVRFIADRQLPDKAIDLLDEACARALLVKNKEVSREELSQRIENAAERGDYKLAQELRELQKSAMPASGEIRHVTHEDISAVIAERTGLDTSFGRGAEWLKDIESKLGESVFGQNEAIKQVAAVLRRAAAGLGNPSKPLASFIFAGPADTGKKTLVGRLAECLFNCSVVRLNGAELSDDTAIIRLCGAPTGYKDAEKGGMLTEFLRLHPISVVALCGVESSSPKVLSLFDEILACGKIRDGRGRVVSFRNSVIVFTVDTEGRQLGFGRAYEYDPSQIVRSVLPASLVSLIDSVVPFARLDRDALSGVITKAFDELASRAQRRGINLNFTQEVVSTVADSCEGSASVALKLVSMYVEDSVSFALLNGDIVPGDSAVCDYDGSGYFVRKVDE